MRGNLLHLVRTGRVIELAAARMGRHLDTEWQQPNRHQGADAIRFRQTGRLDGSELAGGMSALSSAVPKAAEGR